MGVRWIFIFCSRKFQKLRGRFRKKHHTVDEIHEYGESATLLITWMSQDSPNGATYGGQQRCIEKKNLDTNPLPTCLSRVL